MGVLLLARLKAFNSFEDETLLKTIIFYFIPFSFNSFEDETRKTKLQDRNWNKWLSIPLRMKRGTNHLFVWKKKTFNSFEDETELEPELIPPVFAVMLSIPLRMKHAQLDLENAEDSINFQFLWGWNYLTTPYWKGETPKYFQFLWGWNDHCSLRQTLVFLRFVSFNSFEDETRHLWFRRIIDKHYLSIPLRMKLEKPTVRGPPGHVHLSIPLRMKRMQIEEFFIATFSDFQFLWGWNTT